MFKCLSTFALDHAICTEMRIISHKVKSSYIYLTYILQEKNFLSKGSMIYLLRSISRSPEGYIYVIRRKSFHQKGHKHFRKMNCPEGYVQKSDHQKVDSHEITHLQSFFCTIHWLLLKVKCDKTRSKRNADNSEKLVTINGYFFLLWWCFTCWERKQHIFLFGLKPMD